MDAGQELTHTVTTVVNSESQQITNEIKLTDGDTVVLETKNLVNLQNGKTYVLDAKGEIDGRLIRRILNVANNLIGTNAFDFKNIDGTATDGSLIKFTANYDAVLMKFSGTAPVGTTVQILLEDGTSIAVTPKTEGTWEQELTAEHLQLGENNIFVINGSELSQVIEFNIQHKDESPFNPSFTFDISKDGKTVTGTAVDKRAVVHVSSEGWTHSGKVNAEGEFSIVLPEMGLLHGSTLDIWLQYDGVASEYQSKTFYLGSVEIDQVYGQYVKGTAEPREAVFVSTGRNDNTTIYADASGAWRLDFPNGLEQEQLVVVILGGIGGHTPGALIYKGESNVTFALTAQVITPFHIKGKAKPAETVSITSLLNSAYTAIADSKGDWEIHVTNSFMQNEEISVSGQSAEIKVQYVKIGLSVLAVSSTLITGKGQPGEKIRVDVVDRATVEASISDDGEWSALFNPALSNPTAIQISDSNESLQTAYAKFTAHAVNSVQLEGISQSGSKVFANNVETVTDDQNRWKLILPEALQVGESIQVTCNGIMKNVTFMPEFTAYINNDGLSVLGTSAQAQVTITAGGVDTVVTVLNGEYNHVLAVALVAGDQVTVKSGDEVKTLTYTGITTFTAALNSSLSSVSGNVDAPAKIRAVFTDNSMVEATVLAGSYVLDLERTLLSGIDVIVVACIANDALYQAITIEA
ncbi:hypothetical protein [Acinetobacter chengduensis]|uniref:Bacterial Ig domain-containing protein n=1 Tax=Acinetobacter chengduensis TaxID=2420890 RepID=A0ABX9TT85_9GAMM|nr:hypothetical protein [Acinetobacter chengduensis]RLL19001.1 hypothetical protein D9K81_14690 [Acinetobacter chengduensis]